MGFYFDLGRNCDGYGYENGDQILVLKKREFPFYNLNRFVYGMRAIHISIQWKPRYFLGMFKY